MASTIKLKNGSGAPLASDLVQGEPALDLTNKRLYTEDSLGAVIEVGTNPAAEITANAGIALPDSQKATFGDGDDLQIYHDGSNSFIKDAGTGSLFIRTSVKTQFQNEGGTENYAAFNENGSVDLYYDNSLKLATTSTGIDVTGTVTADDSVVIDGNVPRVFLNESDATDVNTLLQNSVGDFQIFTVNDAASVFTKRLQLDHATGDISFYEDTGTTAKFFWDASAERLGIGTTSPQRPLTVFDSADSRMEIRTGTTTNLTALDFSDSANTARGKVTYDHSVDAMTFDTLSDERMRIDSSGNVGIGVTPDSWGGILSKALQVGNVSIAPNSGSVSAGYFGTNWYYDGTNFKYKASNYAGLYAQETGEHKFFTTPSGTAGNNITFTQAMTLDSSGNLGIGTTSPQGEIHCHRTGSSESVIRFTNGITGSTSSDGLRVGIDINEDGVIWMHDNEPILFGTNNTERMRLDASGNLLVSKTSNNFGVSGAQFISGNGGSGITSTSIDVLGLNRLGTEGRLIGFYHDTALEGDISVSGSTVSYNGGHLARWSRLADDSKDTSIVKGTVMTNLDEMVEWSHPAVEAQDAVYDEEGNVVTEAVEAKEAYTEDNEQLNKMAVSSVEGDPNVAGVFVNWDEDDDWNDMNVAMTGDMVIRIAQGTTVARGDLLMSAGDGTAKPQGDDIVRSKTIAKVTSTHVSHTYDDGSYLVPCVLMAC